MKKRIILLLFMCACFQLGLNGQQEQGLLNTKIVMNESRTHFLAVLQDLAYIHKIPIGVELNMTYRQKSFVGMKIENDVVTWDDKLEVQAGTLEEILNQLVRQEPEYTWQVSDGVINVFPTLDRDLFLKSILELKIKKTVHKQKFDRPDLLNIVSGADKFSELLSLNKVEFCRNDPLNQVFRYENTAINGFEVKDTDVKGLLNKFVRLSSQKIWILERTGENKEILSINL